MISHTSYISEGDGIMEEILSQTVVNISLGQFIRHFVKISYFLDEKVESSFPICGQFI